MIGMGAVSALFLASVIASHLPNAERVRGPRYKGNDIVNQLEAYRDRQGKYPLNLDDAGIVSGTKVHGEWRYSPSVDQSQFGLRAWRDNKGNYILSYDKKNGWVDKTQRSD